MTDAPKLVLTDPDGQPTDAVVRAHLDATSHLWDELFDRIRTRHPDWTPEWRYYRDGNSWLLKVTHGSRTICWVSVTEGTFRLTVYLPARAAQAVASSDLRDDLRRQFQNSGSSRTRGMTVVFERDADIDAAEALMLLRDGFR